MEEKRYGGLGYIKKIFNMRIFNFPPLFYNQPLLFYLSIYLLIYIIYFHLPCFLSKNYNIY